jgi:glycosyltransferase involved in cell wall biosynthesis
MEQPFFSIVIPTYNRPQRLETCLKSLTCLNYPRDRFEVIVINDGSANSLESIVNPFKEKLNLQMIRQDNAGPASARNTGAAKAQGKYLVFTDDDCQPDVNWLNALETSFAQNPDGLLGGHTINHLSNNLYSEASQRLIDYLYRYYNADPLQARFFASNNLALSTERFRHIGYFDVTFPLAAGEDRELCDRWLHYGYSMVYVPEALVYHTHRLCLRTFWRQHFSYGRGAFHFHQVRSLREQEPIKVEPLKFYLDLLVYPFSSSSSHPGILVSSLFFVSQVANVAGFFWERWQKNLR